MLPAASCASAVRAFADSPGSSERFIAKSVTRVCWSRVFDLSAFQLKGETTGNGSERKVTAS